MDGLGFILACQFVTARRCFQPEPDRPKSPRSSSAAVLPIVAHGELRRNVNGHRSAGKSVIVVSFRLRYDQAVPFYPVDEPVLLIDSL